MSATEAVGVTSTPISSGGYPRSGGIATWGRNAGVASDHAWVTGGSKNGKVVAMSVAIVAGSGDLVGAETAGFVVPAQMSALYGGRADRRARPARHAAAS